MKICFLIFSFQPLVSIDLPYDVLFSLDCVIKGYNPEQKYLGFWSFSSFLTIIKKLTDFKTLQIC